MWNGIEQEAPQSLPPVGGKNQEHFSPQHARGGNNSRHPKGAKRPREIRNAPAQRVGETDCHTGDIGHWLAMTDSQQTKNILLPIIPRAGGYLQYLFCALGGYHIDAGAAHIRDHHIPGGHGQVGQSGVQRVRHVENLFLGNFTLCADGHNGS